LPRFTHDFPGENGEPDAQDYSRLQGEPKYDFEVGSMTDGDLIPITDEQAKLAQELVKTWRDGAGYIAGILGDLPKDLIGLLVGDRVKALRAERLAKLWENAKNRLHQQGVEEPAPPNLKLALPILAAAADENREELQDLWIRLLAASMNPNQSSQVRMEFSEALHRLDPLDAKIMAYFYQNGGSIPNSEKNKMAESLGITIDALLVSLRNLTNVGFVADYNTMHTGLMPFGREFLRSISD
jgi:Abortive infection alpha